ncbi:MAG: acyl-CoA dehydrogenase family protein [Myxococcota bacterium]
MISFGPTEEQELIRNTLRDFAAQVVRPAARAADEASELPDGFLQQTWELGLTATQLPAAVGGGGEARSPLTNALVLEELACGDAALALAAAAPSAFAFAIADHGTPEQQKRLLPRFCGDRFASGALAWIEPSPVFDPLTLGSVAEAKGDKFVLTGRKRFVVMGDRAEDLLVLARNAQATGGGFAALDAFIVPRGAAGVTIGEREKLLGMKSLPAVSQTLDRVEVPAANRLGGERGIDARRLLAASRAASAALLTGLARGVMEYAIPYAKDRHAFGEAIAQKQAIAFQLADMRIETDAMRWLAWRAASALEHGRDATREAAQAFGYAAEQAVKVSDAGVQVLGGHGFIREHPVEMWYRHARTLSVLDTVAAL